MLCNLSSTLFVALDCCNATTNVLKPCLSGFNRTTTIQDKKNSKETKFYRLFLEITRKLPAFHNTTLALLNCCTILVLYRRRFQIRILYFILKNDICYVSKCCGQTEVSK